MTSRFRSKAPQIVFSCLLSLGLLIYVFYSVEWDKVVEHIWKIHLWVCLPALAMLFIHFALRSQRWRYLLEKGDQVPFWTLFDSIMIGNFATYILPLRVGEFVRPLFLSRHAEYSFSSSFVSVVVERFFDLITVLLTFALVVVFLPGLPDWVAKGAFMLSALALCIFAFLILAAVIPQKLQALIDFLVAPLPKFLSTAASKFLHDLLTGAQILHNARNLFWVLAYSVVIWLTCYAGFYIYLYFFDIQPQIWLALSVAVVVALAVAAPSAPGFLGVYQVACLPAFALFGIEPEIAVAYSIVTHIFQYVVIVVYGIFVLLKYSLHFSDISGEEAA